MIFVRASLLILEKVGYGWRDQEVTLRKEKAKGSQAKRPTEPLMKFRPSRTELSETSRNEAWETLQFRSVSLKEQIIYAPLLRNHFCQKEQTLWYLHSRGVLICGSLSSALREELTHRRAFAFSNCRSGHRANRVALRYVNSNRWIKHVEECRLYSLWMSANMFPVR